MPEQTVAPYPHEGGCAMCREMRLCNACGESLRGAGVGRCTNGRCRSCHESTCTSGGITSPGHGYGRQGGKHFVKAAAA